MHKVAQPICASRFSKDKILIASPHFSKDPYKFEWSFNSRCASRLETSAVQSKRSSKENESNSRGEVASSIVEILQLLHTMLWIIPRVLQIHPICQGLFIRNMSVFCYLRAVSLSPMVPFFSKPGGPASRWQTFLLDRVPDTVLIPRPAPPYVQNALSS